MKLTKKKAIELHRQLWDWLYHHPLKIKQDWPRWKQNSGDIPEEKILAHCFPCQYVQMECKECPLEWPDVIKGERHRAVGFCADKSYFKLWRKAKTPKTRKKYAKLIRDLP